MNPIYAAAEGLCALAFGVLAGCEVRGLENVPREGRVILASNHISWWDPPLMVYALGREGLRRPFFLGKEELFRNPLSRYVLMRLNSIPLDRSRGDVGALKRAAEVLERGEMLGLYPEGTRARGRLLRPKPGVGFLALQTLSPVVAVRVWGTEAFPREVLRVSFGKPRLFEAPSQGASKESYQAIADEVMRAIRSMGWD